MTYSFVFTKKNFSKLNKIEFQIFDEIYVVSKTTCLLNTQKNIIWQAHCNNLQWKFVTVSII